MARLQCWPSRVQQVSHQRWMWVINNMQVRNHEGEESILALKTMTDVTKSRKKGYQWPHIEDWWPLKKVGSLWLGSVLTGVRRRSVDRLSMVLLHGCLTPARGARHLYASSRTGHRGARVLDLSELSEHVPRVFCRGQFLLLVAWFPWPHHLAVVSSDCSFWLGDAAGELFTWWCHLADGFPLRWRTVAFVLSESGVITPQVYCLSNRKIDRLGGSRDSVSFFARISLTKQHGLSQNIPHLNRYPPECVLQVCQMALK